MKLENRLLLPGRLYEARLRARASVAQWSVWSPEVTWRAEEGDSKDLLSAFFPVCVQISLGSDISQ